MNHRLRSPLGFVLATFVTCVAANSQETAAPATATDGFPEYRQRALDWLLTQQTDGVFFVASPRGNHPDTGLTGLALAALQTKPAASRTEAEQKVIDLGLQHLVAETNDDGSIGKRVVNYTTCSAVFALAKADREEFAPVLKGAQRYLLGIQNIESHGISTSDPNYGSVGYGSDGRGDLSNLQFAITALRQTGLDADHEALAKAVVFLQRTQNLPSVNDYEGEMQLEGQTKTQPVRSGGDGGAIYYPGTSSMGYEELADGTLVPRSYGSMTYSLLKTYTLCGIGADDPRVQAAVDWVQKNWDLEVNPGAPPGADEELRHQGLFYYYMVMAQALKSMDVAAVETTDGKLDWRKDLEAKLRELQCEDGTWLNDKSDRWWEGTPTLCTIYALLALDACSQE